VDSSDPVQATPPVCPSPPIDVRNNNCTPDSVLHEHMVELKGLYSLGVRSCAIDGDAVMVGVPYSWWLVASLALTDRSSYSVILWQPVGNDNHTAPLDKVVRDLSHLLALANHVKIGACIYGAEKISPIFGDPKTDHVHLQCTAAVHNLKSVQRCNPFNGCAYCLLQNKDCS
jgi:hypothetical protein